MIERLLFQASPNTRVTSPPDMRVYGKCASMGPVRGMCVTGIVREEGRPDLRGPDFVWVCGAAGAESGGGRRGGGRVAAGRGSTRSA
jgi:hypothetical protein